jgi:hypothetical protein
MRRSTAKSGSQALTGNGSRPKRESGQTEAKESKTEELPPLALVASITATIAKPNEDPTAAARRALALIDASRAAIAEKAVAIAQKAHNDALQAKVPEFLPFNAGLRYLTGQKRAGRARATMRRLLMDRLHYNDELIQQFFDRHEDKARPTDLPKRIVDIGRRDGFLGGFRRCDLIEYAKLLAEEQPRIEGH